MSLFQWSATFLQVNSVATQVGISGLGHRVSSQHGKGAKMLRAGEEGDRHGTKLGWGLDNNSRAHMHALMFGRIDLFVLFWEGEAAQEEHKKTCWN